MFPTQAAPGRVEDRVLDREEPRATAGCTMRASGS
jgi:hypothetical protein